MSEYLNPGAEFGNAPETVCVSVRKIMDACRDQDCMEDLPVYLTAESQETLDRAASVKARSAELLHAAVNVTPIPYQDGYYTLDIQFYYRVIADATLGGVRPVTVYGLATACRQVMLYGGEGTARTFRSSGNAALSQPVGVAEALDPVVLRTKVGSCASPSGGTCGLGELPAPVSAAFDGALIQGAGERQLMVTLGQFSLVRLERETQLMVPGCRSCMPDKACCEGEGCVAEDPCETFSRMQFPVSAFFPRPEDSGQEGCGQVEEQRPRPASPGR